MHRQRDDNNCSHIVDSSESGGTAGVGRRRFLIGTAAGAAAATWAVPNIVTIQAAAAGTRATPDFVTSATAFHHRNALLPYARTITLTTPFANPVQVGDLWLAIVAYDARAGATLTIPAGLTTLATAQHDAGTSVWPANNSVYSVKAYLLARVLTASDISGGQFSTTISTPAAQAIDYGGLRGAAVVYRHPLWNTFSLPTASSNDGFGPVGGGNIVTATFPAAAPAPPTPLRNRIVRFGAARGYGGWYALDPNNDWQSGPGTGRVDYSSNNYGDRALWISDEADNAGASTTGTWYKQRNGNPPNTENWVTFTVEVPG